MANPKVLFGHYIAEYWWNITGGHVTWQASVIYGGEHVATLDGRIHHPRGPEHTTEEGVRAAVFERLKQYADEAGNDKDEVTAFKDD